MRHTIQDLRIRQKLPLEAKIQMSKLRIREWVDYYGVDGVYISFSGGKDSTVLLHLVREDYPEIKAVFVDTGLEYPEIRDFVKTFENVDIVKPAMNFRKVIQTYGYPIISKEVSTTVQYAQSYLDGYADKHGEPVGGWAIADILDLYPRRERANDPRYNKMYERINNTDMQRRLGAYKLAKENGDEIGLYAKILFGELEHKEKGVPTGEISDRYNRSKYKFLLGAPFKISGKCCSIMKKAPLKRYAKETDRVAMTAQMADESMLRTQKWLENGCNAFSLKNPISNPLSFWTEQDILKYIKDNDIKICSVYGEIAPDYAAEDQIDGQIDLSDIGLTEDKRPLKTTGCSRTGCMFCLFGCHLEKSPNRLERMRETHPAIYDYIMRGESEGGLNYKEVIDWVNDHSDLNIKY